MERKDVKGVRKVKVVFLLSKYQYKRFLAGKHPDSILSITWQSRRRLITKSKI